MFFFHPSCLIVSFPSTSDSTSCEFNAAHCSGCPSTNEEELSKWRLLSTFFRTAALLWAAGTANIAAASLRAALAAADTEEEDEEEGSDDDEQHCQPVCRTGGRDRLIVTCPEKHITFNSVTDFVTAPNREL